MPLVSTSTFFQWLSDAQSEVQLEGRLKFFAVNALSDVDGTTLLRELFGRTTESQERILLGQAGSPSVNPLILTLQRELLVRPDDFSDGALVASDRRLRLLPSRLVDLDEQRLTEFCLSRTDRGWLELILGWLAMAALPMPLPVLESVIGREVAELIDVLQFQLGWVHLHGDGSASLTEPWHVEFGRRLSRDLDSSILVSSTLTLLDGVLLELGWKADRPIPRTFGELRALRYLNLALNIWDEAPTQDLVRLSRLRARGISGLGLHDAALEATTAALGLAESEGMDRSREYLLLLLQQEGLIQQLWLPHGLEECRSAILQATLNADDGTEDLMLGCVRSLSVSLVRSREAEIDLLLDRLSSGRTASPLAAFTLRIRRTRAHGDSRALFAFYGQIAQGIATRDPQLSSSMMLELADAWFAEEEWRRATDLAMAVLDSPGFIYLDGEDSERVCRMLVQAGCRCGDKNAVFRGGNALLGFATSLRQSSSVANPVVEARYLNLIHPVLNAASIDAGLSREFLVRAKNLLDEISSSVPQSVCGSWQREVVLLEAARCFRESGDMPSAAKICATFGPLGPRPPADVYRMMSFRHRAEASLYLAKGGRVEVARDVQRDAVATLDDALHLLGMETIVTTGIAVAFLIESFLDIADDEGAASVERAIVTRALELQAEGSPDGGPLLIAAVVTPLLNCGLSESSSRLMNAAFANADLKAGIESTLGTLRRRPISEVEHGGPRTTK